jgi:hypothetical protein
MATKQTATKKTGGLARKKKRIDQTIRSLLARLSAAAPPESDKDLARWVLVKMLAGMVSKVLEGEGELKCGSNDLLKVIQTIHDFDEAEGKKETKEIRVEWVEPEKQ